MVKYAIKRGVRFDYLLVDSWFTNTKLVRFISGRHIKCHLLGMIKLGKTNYATKHGKMNAKQIIKHLQRRRHANTTKYFAVPIVQWTLSWMVCQSVCTFANEDARETGMGCWPQTFLLASLKRIVFMPDDGLPKLHTRIVRPCWTLANASLYILPLKLPASLWQWCSITSCVQWRDLKRMKPSAASLLRLPMTLSSCP